MIKAKKGEGVAVAMLVKEIELFISRFNLIRPMNTSQVIDFSKSLLSRQPYCAYKIGDFKLCFENARWKKYPKVKIFDRMGEDILIEFLAAYDGERDEYFIGAMESNKKNSEQEFNNVVDVIAPILPELNKIVETFDVKDDQKEEEYRKFQAEYFKSQQQKQDK